MLCKEHFVFQALLDVHCVQRWHFIGDGNAAAPPASFCGDLVTLQGHGVPHLVNERLN